MKERTELVTLEEDVLDRVVGGLGGGVGAPVGFLPYALASALGIAGKPDANGQAPAGYFGWGNLFGFL